MDWQGAIERNGKEHRSIRAALERIVVLLLILADLAERAAAAPRPVRFLVLWVLQHADAVAKDFVACDAAGRHWSAALVTVRPGFDPADAMSLALSLRALALIVQIMAARICSRSANGEGREGRPDRDVDGIVQCVWRTACPQAVRFDTS